MIPHIHDPRLRRVAQAPGLPQGQKVVRITFTQGAGRRKTALMKTNPSSQEGGRLDNTPNLIEARNVVAAAPLLRLQIDNCLRFCGVYIVSNPHDFASAVLKGEHVRRMKDSTGHLMTDQYLVSCVAQDFAWISKVYDKTSSYVHLSDTHIASVFSETPREKLDKGVCEIAIGPGDKFSTPVIYEEAVEAFIAATKTVFHYLIGWVRTKETPRNG
jgi:hypothetical protein